MAEAVFKDKNLKKFLKKLTENTADVALETKNKRYLGALAGIVHSDIDDHFKKERGPGKSWKAWSSAYFAKMIKLGKADNKKLQDTGFLRQNFRPTNYRFKKRGIVFYNPTEYARTHDQGDRKRNIPKRQFMWLSKKALKTVEKVALNYIFEGR